jgi:TPP-dependent pyruvate/acetoin dehydrogenase alpha subunit
VNSLIEESVDQAKKSPLPNPEDVTTDVYVSY